jgi:hypothetical protein
MKNWNWKRIGGIAGMLAAVFFVGVFLVEGALRPDYNPIRQYVSELSLGPRGLIQIKSFIVTGILLLLFARGVSAVFPSGKASRWGVWLLYAIGIGILVSGPLVMDPASTPLDQWTLTGTLHQLLGALVFTLMPITCFVFWRRFREDPAWRALSTGTLVVAILIVAAVILLRLPAVPPAQPNAFNPYAGLIQRAALIPFYIWIFIFAFTQIRKESAK